MAGVQVDSVVVSIEAKIAQYQKDMEAAARKTESVFERIRKASNAPITVGSGPNGDGGASAVEKAEVRKQRARRKSVDTTAQDQARISAVIDRAIKRENDLATATERASDRVSKAYNRNLAAAQTRLMSGSAMAAVPGQNLVSTKDTVRDNLIDRIRLQNEFNAAVISGDRAAINGTQDKLRYIQSYNAYVRQGLSDTDAQENAERDVLRVVQARVAVEQQASGAAAGATARVANGYRNLGRQIQDVGVSLVGGQNPFLVIAQQAPQVADALTDVGKKAGVAGLAIKAFAFIATPLGAVLFALASAAAILGSRFLGAEKEAKKLDGATVNLRNALRLGGDAAVEARKAIDEYNASQKEAITISGARTAATLKAAEADIEAAKAARENIAAQIESQRNYAARQSREGGEGAATGVLTQFEQEKKQNEEDINRLETRAQNLRRQVGENIAQRATDPEFAITERYKDLRQVLDDRLTREKATTAEIAKQTTALRNRERAELDALRKQQQAENASGRGNTTTLLSPVTGGRITSGVGSRTSPTAGASRNHKGIDIAVPIGTPVRAGANGVVISSGKLGGFGNAVVVDYGGGTIATYGHLSQLLVSRGQRVAAGENIAKSGNSGVSTGAHLHYQVTQRGKVVDPSRPVRVGDQGLAEARDASQEQRDAERKADEAKRLAEERQRNEDRYNDRIAKLDDEIAGVKGEQVTALEAQRDAQKDAAKRENDASLRELDRLVRDGEAGGDVKIERERYATLLAQRNAAIEDEYKKKIAERDAESKFLSAESGLISEQRNAELARDETRTRESRLEVDLKLLDIADRLRIAELDRVIATEEVGSVLRDRAIAEKGFIENSSGKRQDTVRDGARSPLAQYRSEVADVGNSINDSLEQVQVDGLKSLNDGITDAIVNSKSLGDVFSNIADQIISDLIRIAVQQAIVGPLLGAGGTAAGGGLLGGVIGAIGGLFGGSRASGGDVSPGKVYRINENGPEYFQPAGAGKIIPTGAVKSSGRGNTIIQQTVKVDARNSVNPEGFARQILGVSAQQAQQAASASAQVVYQNIPSRLDQYNKTGI